VAAARRVDVLLPVGGRCHRECGYVAGPVECDRVFAGSIRCDDSALDPYAAQRGAWGLACVAAIHAAASVTTSGVDRAADFARGFTLRILPSLDRGILHGIWIRQHSDHSNGDGSPERGAVETVALALHPARRTGSDSSDGGLFSASDWLRNDRSACGSFERITSDSFRGFSQRSQPRIVFFLWRMAGRHDSCGLGAGVVDASHSAGREYGRCSVRGAGANGGGATPLANGVRSPFDRGYS